MAVGKFKIEVAAKPGVTNWGYVIFDSPFPGAWTPVADGAGEDIPSQFQNSIGEAWVAENPEMFPV